MVEAMGTHQMALQEGRERHGELTGVGGKVGKRMRGRLAADGRQYGRQWMESLEGDGELNFLHAMSLKIS